MDENIIKGLFSYSGNKYKIYKSHLIDIIKKFDKVHEIFLGSGVCLYNSNRGGIGIDIDSNIISLHNSLFDENLIPKIKDTYNSYFPNGRNKDGYMNLRKDFNKSYIIKGTNLDNVHMLHLLGQLSFNSLLRFSKNGFNVPFGMKEIDISRIELHQKIINSKDIKFISGNYFDLDLSIINKENDLIYIDPPYIASKFQYRGWNIKDDILLLEYIDELNKNNYKFILSNTFKHRNAINEHLISWSNKYNLKNINTTYNSWTASVRSVKTEKNTHEVIISNF